MNYTRFETHRSGRRHRRRARAVSRRGWVPHPPVRRADQRRRGRPRRSHQLRWSIPALLAHASRDAVIRPGDVLDSSTVGNGGCLSELWGRRRQQDPSPLRPGDTVSLTVDRSAPGRERPPDPGRIRPPLLRAGHGQPKRALRVFTAADGGAEHVGLDDLTYVSEYVRRLGCRHVRRNELNLSVGHPRPRCPRQRGRGVGQASALALSASNSGAVMVPESSSARASAI